GQHGEHAEGDPDPPRPEEGHVFSEVAKASRRVPPGATEKARARAGPALLSACGIERLSPAWTKASFLVGATPGARPNAAG
ncbi:MAG TPA: hypothetical protein PLW10_19270, partial [Myxococcota bacterium]|nr:hypothetical protein [Myxococcota bacterium]